MHGCCRYTYVQAFFRHGLLLPTVLVSCLSPKYVDCSGKTVKGPVKRRPKKEKIPAVQQNKELMERLVAERAVLLCPKISGQRETQPTLNRINTR